jgi:hypothetical protein
MAHKLGLDDVLIFTAWVSSFLSPQPCIANRLIGCGSCSYSMRQVDVRKWNWMAYSRYHDTSEWHGYINSHGPGKTETIGFTELTR